ncbi:MAG: PAS domain S-box protein [Solirubrobacteraceae bacterium]
MTTVSDLHSACLREPDGILRGYDHAQLSGRSSVSITHPDDVAADADARQSLLAGEATSQLGEVHYLSSSGQLVWTAINLTLIRHPEGQPLYFIAQVLDITPHPRTPVA